MRLYEEQTFADAYRKVLRDLLHVPQYKTQPRDQKINEVINASIVITDPMECMYQNFRRSSQFSYIAAELIWYFAGRNDLEFIEKYAKFWQQVANEDGTLNSAYGNLIFAKKNQFGYSQWNWAYESLINDSDSRQAIMHFNTPDHQFKGNKDFVCTLNGIFHIRENKLDFTVEMRSNDVILGLRTDIAFFCILQQQMLNLLRDKYTNLEIGTYTHIVNSLHLYERNFELVNDMLREDFFSITAPTLNNNFVDIYGNKSDEFCELHDSVVLGNDFTSDDELFNWIYKKIKKQ